MTADLGVGDRVLVRYRGKPLYHERLIGAHGRSPHEFVIATPDMDVYEETFAEGGDIEAVLTFGDDRELPAGVSEDQAYLMYNPRTATGDLSAAQVRGLLARCRSYAAELIPSPPAGVVASGPADAGASRRRLVGKQPVVLPPAERVEEADEPLNRLWVVADPSRGVALGTEVDAPAVFRGTQGLARISDSWVLVELIRAEQVADYVARRWRELDAGRRRSELSLMPSSEGVAEARRAVEQAQRSLRSNADRVAWLREQLERIEDPQVSALVHDSFTESGNLKPTLGELMNRLEELGGAGRGDAHGGAHEIDARVLEVVKSPLGVWHRDFRAAVEMMRESTWSDWPIAGPRTVLYVLTFVSEHFQTPEQRHARFVSDGRLQPHDAGVGEHHFIMKMLQFWAVFDQLDLPQLAWAELACRRAQLIDLKHRERVVVRTGKEGGKESGKGSAPDPFEDAHLYLGLSSSRGMLCVSPELEAWVGRELSSEYMAMKERRKAIEERKLLKSSP